MAASRPVVGISLVFLVLLSLLLGSFAAPVAPTAPSGSHPTPAVGVPVSPHLPLAGPEGRPSAPSNAAGPAPAGAADPAAPVVRAVEQQIANGKLNPRDVFLPSSFRPGPISPGETVSPLLTSVPAPMGLSDIGVGSGGSYSYTTSSFEGSLQFASFSAFSPGYPAFAEAPNWTSIQLNTVATPMAYPGADNGTFWIQNVVHFDGSEIQFEDNIWNFSALNSVMTPKTILSGGGHIYQDEFYFAFGATNYTVSYPLTLTLYNNLTTVTIGGVAHPEVFFNYSLADLSPRVSGSYDHVVFNGTAVATPAFEVNGAAYNPFNSLYDAEMIIGGNGGGSNANVQTLRGNLTVASWNSTSGRYQTIRSAYDYGPDTGETSLGVAAYYVGTTEYLNQGPSMLYGLWNTTTAGFAPHAKSGWVNINVTVTPSFGFVFATPNASFARPLAQANLSYAPTDGSGLASTALPPLSSGSYVFAGWANGFAPGSVNVTNNATGKNASLHLTSSSTVLDAPVYLSSSAEAATYGLAGLPGTGWLASNSTLWLNASSDALAAPFLRLNDFSYPTFVLFAARGIDSPIVVNGFTQNPSTFAFKSYNATDTIPGWSQGYFFFGGTGKFSVSHTTIRGNTSLFYSSQTPVEPPAAVEFYGTAGSSASSIAVAQDSFGVVLVGASGATVSHVTTGTGGVGALAISSTALHLSSLTANGTDVLGFPSWAADLSNDTGVTLTGVTATNASLGLEVANATTWTVNALTAASGSVALDAAYSSHGTIATLDVTGASAAGSWSNSSYLALSGLTVSSSIGLDLLNTHFVAVAGVTVTGNYGTGFISTGIDEFVNSSYGNFSAISAAVGAIGLNATNATHVNLTGLGATGGSVGATLASVSDVIATGLSAANLSVALLWNHGTIGSVLGGTLGNTSVGVAIANVSHLSVSGLSANESVLPANPYFVNPTTFLQFAMAPVALDNDSIVAVGNLSSNAYPFGVWMNYTNNATIVNVSAWNGGVGVSTNLTNTVEISELFAYGNGIGLNLTNATLTTVESSTLEDSVAYGLRMVNSSGVTVIGNNFVANNGSSTSGAFSAQHAQVLVNNSTGVQFTTTFGNYWSDHTGAGAYVINASANIRDTKPAAAFIFNWLEFVAVGLPSGTPWGVTLRSVSYTSVDPLFFIPSWSLPGSSRIAYTVNPVPSYLPTPARGTVLYVGNNVTVTIDFAPIEYTVAFTAAGLPSGTPWSVTFNGTARSNTTSGGSGTIDFVVIAGSYAYAIALVPGYTETPLVPAHGMLTVGSNLTEALTFTQVTYAVTFSESGLTGGTNWSVVLNGVNQSTTGTSIVFQEPNATGYTYSISTIPGWGQSTIPPSGSIPVNGAPVTENLVFGPTYAITFTEHGLASGTKWYVTFDGVTENSTGTSVAFRAPDGTYAFSIPSITGLDATPGSGHLTVSGADLPVSVAFAPPPPPAPVSPWIYIGGGIAAVLVVGALATVLLRRRRQRAPPVEDEESDAYR